MKDVNDLLQGLAEKLSSPESTPRQRPSGKLKWYKPSRRYLPNKARDKDKIDTHLWATFLQLYEGKGRWPLYVHGPAGTGKTAFALYVVDHTLGTFTTTMELSEAVRKEMMSDHGSVADYWRYMAHRNMVAVDDAGSQNKVTDHHQCCFKHLLDLREGMPLIVTSNIGPDAIAEIYGDPVASRLAGGTEINLQGPDRRVEI